MNKGIMLLVFTAILPGIAVADIDEFSYVQGGVYSLDTAGSDLFGFQVAGSVEFTEKAFARASYNSLSDETNNIEFNWSKATVGAGYVFYSAAGRTAYGGAELISGKVDFGPANADGDGFGFFLGMRNELIDGLEYNVEMNIEVVDSENQFNSSLGLVYALQNDFSIVGNLGTLDSNRTWSLGIRLDF